MTGAAGVKSAFHELDLPDADDLVVKSRLLRFVAEEVRRRGLDEEQIGVLLGLDRSAASALMSERVGRFSIEELMTLVGRLGFRPTIHIEGAGIAFDVPYEHAA